ncbi:MAG: LA_2272 family surface repeat-containing protein [Gemmatimonadota bacterium]
MGGIGVGAPRIEGVAVGGVAVGAAEVEGLMVAGLFTRIVDDDGRPGYVKGLVVSPWNHIDGATRGLSLGIINYTWSLHGIQVGLINIARRNPPGRRVLPIMNWNFRRQEQD